MQIRDRLPVDAVTGACIVTYRVPAEGEPVVDLDLDVETLPAWGKLCVSAEGVRLMMTCLGWELPEENVLNANVRYRDDNKRLKAENTRLREAITAVLDAGELANLRELVAT